VRVLEIEDLLEEVGVLLLPRLKLGVLLLNSMLQVHNRVGPGVYLLSSLLQLSASVTQLSLDLAQAAVHKLQLSVLIKDTDPLLTEAMVLVTQPLSVQGHPNGQPLILIHAGAGLPRCVWSQAVG
jgi:hypothetical protein